VQISTILEDELGACS